MTTITYGRETVRSKAPDFGALQGIRNRVADYIARSRAQRQLEQLDDRLLLDIGLKRSDISLVVWKR